MFSFIYHEAFVIAVQRLINQVSLSSSFFDLCIFFPSQVLLEPVGETMHTRSHLEDEDEEVEVLDDAQTMKDCQEEKDEAGTKGEDWDEVRD